MSHLPLVTLVLQAAPAPPAPSFGTLGPSRNTLVPATHTGKRVSPAAFGHAVALARLILHDLRSTALLRMAGHEWEGTWRELENADRGFFPAPGVPQEPAGPGGDSNSAQSGPGIRSRKLVEAMINLVRENQHHPTSLKDLASALNRNASYLSTLFRQTTGVTFHHFLQQDRLLRAKELLGDPRYRVREVARTAGYGSAAAFRHAFKAQEGVSPESWRLQQ